MEHTPYPVYVHIGTSIHVSTLPEHCRAATVDTTINTYEAMTVKEAREFVQQAHERPLQSPARTMVLVSGRLSEVVQNTLLKILEEPPPTTEIHIIIPQVASLLPTVRSRVQIMSSEESVDERDAEAVEFLAASIPERISCIAAWHKAENKSAGTAVLKTVGRWLATQPPALTTDMRATYQRVDTWYEQPGANRKMLLEELALSLPTGISV